VADGGVHSGEHLYALNVPLAAGEQRLAANWVQFYGTHGMEGLRELNGLFGGSWGPAMRTLRDVLAGGPEQARGILEGSAVFSKDGADRWLPFFFPENPRPVYLLLDLGKMHTDWFQYGTWDFDRRESQKRFFGTFTGIRRRGGTLTNGYDLSIDVEEGVARAGDRSYPLKELVFIRRGEGPTGIVRERRAYERDDGYFFWLIDGVGFGGIMNGNVAATTMARLFVGLDFDRRYFRPVRTRLPFYQVWEVRGDAVGREG
jgi:dolichyl-diphosphooligosaccharide--protein glycosyltransferase